MLRLRVELVPHGVGDPRQIGCAVIGQTDPADGTTYRYAGSVWDDLDLTTPVLVAVDHDRTDGLWQLHIPTPNCSTPRSTRLASSATMQGPIAERESDVIRRLLFVAEALATGHADDDQRQEVYELVAGPTRSLYLS